MAYEDKTFATSASATPRMKVNVDLTDSNKTFFTVDEWYSPKEMEQVWKELDFLTDFEKFEVKDDNTLQIDLDEAYKNKSLSYILRNRYKDKLELFANQVDRTWIEGTGQEFLDCKKVNTTLRYFHQSMGWEKHSSEDKFVSYHLLWKEPLQFENGDLMLGNRKIKAHQSRLVFLKGQYDKSITGINFIDPKRMLGNGLYVITTTYS
jgi:hypothetical protein